MFFEKPGWNFPSTILFGTPIVMFAKQSNSQSSAAMICCIPEMKASRGQRPSLLGNGSQVVMVVNGSTPSFRIQRIYGDIPAEALAPFEGCETFEGHCMTWPTRLAAKGAMFCVK